MSDPASSTPEGHKVFTGNLTYAVTDDSLRAFFAPVAEDIISAQVITRGTRSAGYGFVTVKSLQAAQKACELLDKKELEGRQVVVEVAKPAEQKEKERSDRRSERRAGRARGKAPPGDISEAEVGGNATKADPVSASEEPASQRKRPNKRRNLRKKVKKTDEDETPAAEVNGDKPVNDTVTATPRKKATRAPREKREPRPQGVDPAGDPSATVLFVANLGFNVDDTGLSELFTSAGINVVSARVVRRRWGKPRKSKGYGFVDVGGEEEQKKAIAALQGKSIDGREIAVKVAVNAKHMDEDAESGGNSPVKEGSPEATIVAS